MRNSLSLMSSDIRALLARVFAPLFAIALVLSATAQAQAVATLANTGVDVDQFVTATITALGAVVVVVVGGYFGFLLVRKAMRWGRVALG